MNMIKRVCPICEESLYFEDFVYLNVGLTHDKCIRIWYDDRLTIICCSCWGIIHCFITYSYSITLKFIPSCDNFLYSIIFDIGNNDKSYCYLSPKEYQNLKKYGVDIKG